MIERLYARFFCELVAWCRTMTGNTSSAEDLVQEGFLRAMRHTATLETLTEYQQRAWLYRTIKNLYIDQIRHTAYEVTEESIPETKTETDDYAEVLAAQLLMLLPDKERILFQMRYLEGYTASEIGSIFQMPPATVRSHLSSARKRLRNLLEEKG